MSEPDIRSCAACARRHEVAAVGQASARLECRALPPIQDVARHAIFPQVTADHHCHVHFVLDPAAAKALASARAEAQRLERAVAASAAPGGDLVEAMQVMPAESDAAPKSRNAPRARTVAATPAEAA